MGVSLGTYMEYSALEDDKKDKDDDRKKDMKEYGRNLAIRRLGVVGLGNAHGGEDPSDDGCTDQ